MKKGSIILSVKFQHLGISYHLHGKWYEICFYLHLNTCEHVKVVTIKPKHTFYCLHLGTMEILYNHI